MRDETRMSESLLQQLTGDWILGQAILVALIGARIAGMVFSMPMLSFGMPLRFRALIVFAITIVVMPNVTTAADRGLSQIAAPDIAISIAREAIFGMLIGAVVQLLATGIQLAGELIAIAAGLQMAQSADPSSGESVPEISRLLGMLIVAVLFAAGGHRMLIDALLHSFQSVPPLSFAIDIQTTNVLIDQLSVGVESGLRVAAPILGCVMLSNLVVALISRSVPQLNVLAIGLNLNVMAVLVITSLTIGSAGIIFQTELARAISRLSTAVNVGPDETQQTKPDQTQEDLLSHVSPGARSKVLAEATHGTKKRPDPFSSTRQVLLCGRRDV